jgi:hypothetical protein
MIRLILIRSGLKTPSQVQGQGVTPIESGAYTLVREHFNWRDNAAIGPVMGFSDHF